MCTRCYFFPLKIAPFTTRQSVMYNRRLMLQSESTSRHECCSLSAHVHKLAQQNLQLDPVSRREKCTNFRSRTVCSWLRAAVNVHGLIIVKKRNNQLRLREFRSRIFSSVSIRIIDCLMFHLFVYLL